MYVQEPCKCWKGTKYDGYERCKTLVMHSRSFKEYPKFSRINIIDLTFKKIL